MVNPVTPSAEDRAWRDAQKRYWKKQIRVAKALNWITAITMLVGVAGAIFLYRQTRTAIDQLHLSQQPWVAITEVMITKPLTFHSDETVEIGFQMILKNVGHSPAAVNYVVRHVVLSYNPEDARIKQRESCVGGVAFGAGTLLQGDTRTMAEITFRLGKNDIRFSNGVTEMWLVGCIAYVDQLGTWYPKPFIYKFNKAILATYKGVIGGDFEQFPFLNKP
jgi:hypothetical protein